MQLFTSQDPKMLGNWFQPHNVDHLRAYRQLEETGKWPEAFVQEMDKAGVVSHQGWQVVILSRLASAWLENRLGPV